MLAVFDKDVVKVPAGLDVCGKDGNVGATKPSCSGMDLVHAFEQKEMNAILGKNGAMAYSTSLDQGSKPRSFACLEGIFVLWNGQLSNLHQLRQSYGIVRPVAEDQLMIELYKTLRDRAPYSTDTAIRHLRGPFAFVLYDSVRQSVFAATDCSDGASLFWGCAADGSLAFSDNAELLSGCGSCVAPFPNGCLFSSQTGLISYENPNQPMKAVPKRNSGGQVCGSFFKVDSQADVRQRASGLGMRHVGSDSNF